MIPKPKRLHQSLPAFQIQSIRLPHLLALLLSLSLAPDGKGIVDIGHGDVDGPGGDKDPEHVEEDEVDPLVHEVARVEVVVLDEPLGAKGDEAAVELHGRHDDDEDVGTRVLFGNAVADEARQRAR
jgi:hypothetical protein